MSSKNLHSAVSHTPVHKSPGDLSPGLHVPGQEAGKKGVFKNRINGDLVAGTIKHSDATGWLVSDGYTLHVLPRNFYYQITEAKDALNELFKLAFEAQKKFAKEMDGEDDDEEDQAI